MDLAISSHRNRLRFVLECLSYEILRTHDSFLVECAVVAFRLVRGSIFFRSLLQQWTRVRDPYFPFEKRFQDEAII